MRHAATSRRMPPSGPENAAEQHCDHTIRQRSTQIEQWIGRSQQPQPASLRPLPCGGRWCAAAMLEAAVARLEQVTARLEATEVSGSLTIP